MSNTEEQAEVDLEEIPDEDEGPRPVSGSRNYVEVPEGCKTLVGFAKLLAAKPPEGRYVLVKPQVLYSTNKNTKSFPAYQHVDGRWIINIQEGLKWWDEKEARKSERAAEAQAETEPEAV